MTTPKAPEHGSAAARAEILRRSRARFAQPVGPRLVAPTNNTAVSIEFPDPAKVFEPFFSTKVDGMGMGLCICKSIVEAHHGALWVAASGESGTTFSFRLPIERLAQL